MAGPGGIQAKANTGTQTTLTASGYGIYARGQWKSTDGLLCLFQAGMSAVQYFGVNTVKIW
jgi:hypothetical protein